MEFSEQFKAYIRSINKVKSTNEVKAKKLSGYNLYCQEMRSTLEGTSIEIMKKLGEKWKGESDANKLKYKEKADKLNVVAVKDAAAVVVEEDALVGELKLAINDLIKKFKKDAKKRVVVEPVEVVPEPVVEVVVPETVPEPVVVEKVVAKKRVVKKKL
jgi:hypothetical protein